VKDMGKVLYRSTAGKDERGRLLGSIGFVMGIIGISLGILAILIGGDPLFAGMGITYGAMGSLMGYRAITLEVIIGEKGIAVPGSIGRIYISYKDIAEIRLNNSPENFNLFVEIVTKEGKVIKVNKNLIKNWKHFYDVVMEHLSKKVKVVAH